MTKDPNPKECRSTNDQWACQNLGPPNVLRHWGLVILWDLGPWSLSISKHCPRSDVASKIVGRVVRKTFTGVSHARTAYRGRGRLFRGVRLSGLGSRRQD